MPSASIIARLRRSRDRLLGRMDVQYYRSLGMAIGENVSIGPDCRLDPSTAWMITIGDNVVFAPGVHVLAHDASLRRRIGYTLIKHTLIGNNVFIGTGSIILPGVCIGDDVVVGAGSLVNRDIPSGTLSFGHPAEVIIPLASYVRKMQTLLQQGNRYNEGTPGRILTLE